MKQRRRSRVLLLLFAAIALVAAACGSDSDDETSTSTPGGSGGEGGVRVGMVFDIGGKGDKSFNDSAFEGLTRAGEELGVEVKELEPSEDGANREALLRQLAEEEYDLIIGVGFAFDEVMPAVAADFPETSFAIVDGNAEGENIALLKFAEEQGSYLVGAIAAQKSETGTIGFVGGVEMGLIKKFEAGYTAGAQAVNPDITVEVKYLSPDGDFSGFQDPAGGKTTAAGLYDAGADVVYHAAGGSGTGVFEAAAEADKWAIGVDSNQYLTAPADQQEHILSSMLKRVDVAVYGIIEAYVNGEFAAGATTFSLENDGVGYATDGDFIDDVEAIEALKAEIIAGEVEVPTEP